MPTLEKDEKSLSTPAGKLLTGPAVAGALDALATLRLDIFLEYPYLYRGRREDELNYLRSYAEQPDACVILAAEGGEAIGAATGMPLSHENSQLLEAFADSALNLGETYYVGELLLRPAYCSRGLGRRLLAQLESEVLARGRYRQLTCATVERPADHPLRPPDFIPITRFLARTGFVRLPGVTTHFAWREPDGIQRDHVMQFWMKELQPDQSR
ncbi:GNAT family acetyltransferase [Desulfuromonas carbonis]|uniref:GNAT family N-acetyltransferase n=1 Tax=Desulfuromonas sp. DDH964 TaxID=1823759 RepID=UPI00078BA7A4|nr:GNAT family N-acetyltransferase [Desulfuromonas sp. DDH964]AMV70527.1 GCN5 family acetyltransferase [Desulfuromonas sp. DDH964]